MCPDSDELDRKAREMAFKSQLLKYESPLWTLLHRSSKPLLRAACWQIYNRCYKNIYKIKLEKGWINYEVERLHQNLGELIAKDFCMDPTKFKSRVPTSDWTHMREDVLDFKNKDVRFWYSARAITCCMLDEDSFYLLRFFYFLDLLFRDKEKYQLSKHKSRAYWNWEEERNALVAFEREWRTWHREKYPECLIFPGCLHEHLDKG